MPDALPAVRGQLITDAVNTRLDTLTDVTIYRSQADSSPPLDPDGEGQVAPYVVIHPFPTTPGLDQDLDDTGEDVDYAMQLTCVAGWSADCEYLADRVHALIFRWAPTVADVTFGRFRPPTGYQPGPVRVDLDVSPPRFWLPLQFRIPAIT